MCPVLGTSASFFSAFGMSICVMLVLLMSNIVISLIRKIVPNEVRIPVYIIIIATIVTVVDMFVNAFLPDIYSVLGSFLQLIVVNCIILGRAESFASKNTVVDSIMDALGIGLGFLVSICVLGICREVLGTGALKIANLITGETITTITIFPSDYAISLLVQPAGAFLMLGLGVAVVSAIMNSIENKKALKAKEEAAKAKAAAAANK
jgi:electron transport complex protein RnfE